jgi:hypothetical protein
VFAGRPSWLVGRSCDFHSVKPMRGGPDVENSRSDKGFRRGDVPGSGVIFRKA